MHADPSTDSDLPVGLFTRLRPLVGMLILVIVALVVYAPALNGDFVWGDHEAVTENEVLRSGDGLRRIWFEPRSTPHYKPLVHTTFWIQYQLHGLNPQPYHALNVSLHILNALLLLGLLRYLKVPGAWLAAALFLLHPISVESVAWITQRTNTLSLFCYLAALAAYCRAYGLRGVHPSMRRFWGWFALGTLLFLGALFSKTVTCTLPAALLLLIWWKRGTWSMRAVWPVLALFVVGLIVGLAAVWSEKHHAFAQGTSLDMSFIERGLVAGRVLWFYAGKVLLPVQHTFIYPRWVIDAGSYWAYAFPLAALAVVVVLWCVRHRLGRGPLVAVLFYAGTLFPALGFFDVYRMRFSFVADHFQYHAGVGLFVLFAGALATIANRMAGNMYVREQEMTRWIFASLSLPLLAVLGMLSWKQAHIYQNEIALWRDTIAKNPAASIAYGKLADVLHREGRLEEADSLLRRSVEENPDVLEASFNLGRLLQDMGRYEEASEYFQRALEIDPGYAPAHNNLGVVLFRMGRRDEAMEHWETALRIQPDYVDVHRNRGNALVSMGRLGQAVEAYQRALQAAPDDQQIRFRMGVLYFRQGRHEEAVRVFREIVVREPGHADALNNLGLSLSRLGRPGDALEYYDRATTIRPSFTEAWHNRGVALERVGRYDEAENAYRRALDADPHFEPAQKNLRLLESTRPLR